MYLILSGRVDVLRKKGSNIRRVAVLYPGEIFGEIGYVRETQRTADIRALAPVEVLRFNYLKLEKDLKFFPFIVINWKINEQLRLSNPFRAGPAGPAGLELIYSPQRNWELGVGGAYRSYRFRLDDTSAVPNGIGENEFLAGFLRVQRKLGSKWSLDLATGALFAGELTIENSDGNGRGEDKYDTAPFVALTLEGKF